MASADGTFEKCRQWPITRMADSDAVKTCAPLFRFRFEVSISGERTIAWIPGKLMKRWGEKVGRKFEWVYTQEQEFSGRRPSVTWQAKLPAPLTKTA